MFEAKETGYFRRSVQDLVLWLREDLATAPAELANLRRLLDILAAARLDLPTFVEKLAPALCSVPTGLNPKQAQLCIQIIFGKTYLPKVAGPAGSAAYWHAKAQADVKLKKLPVYFDVASEDPTAYRVADLRTGRSLNKFLLEADPLPYTSEVRKSVKKGQPGRRQTRGAVVRDPFTDEEGVRADDFPEPKLRGEGLRRER